MDTEQKSAGRRNGTRSQAPGDWVPLVRAALEGLRFGSVTLVVQDGRVIQVDRLEKQRVPRETGIN